MNLISLKRTPVLKNHFIFVPKVTFECMFDYIYYIDKNVYTICIVSHWHPMTFRGKFMTFSTFNPLTLNHRKTTWTDNLHVVHYKYSFPIFRCWAYHITKVREGSYKYVKKGGLSVSGYALICFNFLSSIFIAKDAKKKLYEPAL